MNFSNLGGYSLKTIGAALCGAALLACAPVLAHKDGDHGKRGGTHGHVMQDPAVRLAEAKAALNLTPTQLPAWAAYENFALRTASQRKQLMESAKTNNLAREQVREQMRALFTQNSAEGKAIRQALHDVLTPEQREIAKQLRKTAFHGRHGHGERGMRG